MFAISSEPNDSHLNVDPISGDAQDFKSPGSTLPESLRLMKSLSETPWDFDFFGLLRRLDARHDGPGFGRSNRPQEDPVRLCQRASMSFAPSSVTELAQHPTAPLVRFGFSGLFGANGALPLHLTEWIHDRRHREGDLTLEAFADIFHHRFFSLLYRAWADSKPIVALDADPEDDPFRRFIGSFGGMFGVDMSNLDNHGRRYYIGHIGTGSARPETIEQVLEDRFGVPVTVKEYIPEWLRIEDDDRITLGSARLGDGKILGQSVFSCTTRFELEVGPLTKEQFESFLPSGANVDGLRELLIATVGMDMGWQIRPVLEAGASMGVVLGQGSDASGTRLGYDSWMLPPSGSQKPCRDLVINDADYQAL